MYDNNSRPIGERHKCIRWITYYAQKMIEELDTTGRKNKRARTRQLKDHLIIFNNKKKERKEQKTFIYYLEYLNLL